MTRMLSNFIFQSDILTWTTLGIVTAVSLLGNGFITIVQIHQWLLNRKLLPYNVILISLSTSRMIMQLVSSVICVQYFINFETHIGSYEGTITYLTWMFFNMASLWSATWLSIFYCVKVINFDNRFFLWLKPRINMLAPRLLGLSILITTIFFLPFVVKRFGDSHSGNLTEILTGSANQSKVSNLNNLPFLHLNISYTYINFCISIFASVILLISLWKHTRHLKKSGIGDKDLSTQVHINVMIPLLIYVFLYTLYLSSFIYSATSFSDTGRTEMLVINILATAFPSVHSILLILTNPKLRKTAAHILNIRQRSS